MKVLIKNKLGKDKYISLLNGKKYLLKNGEQKIIGDYDEVNKLIYKFLIDGFIICKINDEDIKPEMLIDSILDNDIFKSEEDKNSL